MTSDAALGELLTLIEDFHDYNPSQVQIFDQHPSAVDFCKQVNKGLPCVYPAANSLKGHAAVRWSRETLIESVKEAVEVAVTPDGRADSLCAVPSSDAQDTVFLQPANINMTISDLFERLDAPRKTDDPVYYLQSQNSNLTSTPLESLFKDFPSNFDFADTVLGEPEAVNVWIGDERSVTSAHRDPYENLYVVLRGCKTFTLWPPVDEVCMHATMVRTGRYTYDSAFNNFAVVMDKDEQSTGPPPEIPWIPIDPQRSIHELYREYPLYRHASPRTITVPAGQMLYLPSGWYHHVAQECGIWDDGSQAPCIAVNYWYDMEYEGEKHVTRQLIGRLAQRVQSATKLSK